MLFQATVIADPLAILRHKEIHQVLKEMYSSATEWLPGACHTAQEGEEIEEIGEETVQEARVLSAMVVENPNPAMADERGEERGGGEGGEGEGRGRGRGRGKREESY